MLNIEILSNDGKAKIVDFQNWINEGGFYFLPLIDNGADISPDVVYEIGIDIKS